jgi:hypothetical protein
MKKQKAVRKIIRGARHILTNDVDGTGLLLAVFLSKPEQYLKKPLEDYLVF